MVKGLRVLIERSEFYSILIPAPTVISVLVVLCHSSQPGSCKAGLKIQVPKSQDSPLPLREEQPIPAGTAKKYDLCCIVERQASEYVPKYIIAHITLIKIVSLFEFPQCCVVSWLTGWLIFTDSPIFNQIDRILLGLSTYSTLL